MPSDETIITKQETSEVLDNKGNSSPSEGAKTLSDIFDKMIEAKSEGEDPKLAIKEVEQEKAEQAKPEPKAEPVKEEPSAKSEPSDLDKKLEDKKPATEEPAKEEDVSRDSLRKMFEKKDAEKAKAADKEDKKDTLEDVSEEELQVLPHDKPKTAKRINALLSKIKEVESRETETRKQAEEKAKRLAELEQQLSTVKSSDPTTDEKVKAQLDELAMYRRRYELDNDPELKEKFDTRIEAQESAIVDHLKKRGATDELVKLIQNEGGWARFASSNNTMTLPDEDGGTRQVSMAELAETIVNALPLGERKAIEAAMMDQIQTQSAKKLHYEDQVKKAKEYFSKRDEEGRKAQAEQQRQIEEARKSVEKWQSEVEQSDWLKDKELPSKATPEQKQAIQEHNRYNAQLRSLLKKAVSTTDLNGMLEIVHDSVRYYDERRNTASLKREVDSLRAELQAKQAELDKFKGASRSVPRAGSVSSNASAPTATEKRPRSLEEAFDRLSRGESINEE
jgi:hypothetical protein